MHAGSETLLIRDPAKESGQEIALFRSEGRTERLLMFPRHAANRRQRLASVIGQMQGVDAPVARIVAALDELSPLQVVDQRHEPARRDAETAAERLLAGPC